MFHNGLILLLCFYRFYMSLYISCLLLNIRILMLMLYKYYFCDMQQAFIIIFSQCNNIQPYHLYIILDSYFIQHIKCCIFDL